MGNTCSRILLTCLLWACAAQAWALQIHRLYVQIHTRDVRFAGTDDPIHLLIGGRDFNLDNADRNDFERDNDDAFEIHVDDAAFTLEMVRAIGSLVVAKTEDSYFGGGWAFGGISIRAESMGADPIYQNDAVNVWLDSGGLEWSSTFGDDGWNIPEEPPFPPCISGDVDLGLVIDSDCDGIPDGEDTKFDLPVDSDGDGLPDPYETDQGLDPDNPDQDGDGWADGKKNRRSVLILTRIDCLDEEEDIGNDEIYVVAEDVRYPATTGLDGNWPLNEGDHTSPFVIIDSRVAPPARAGDPPLAYTTRLRLREADPYFFKKPTDDTYKITELAWGEEGDYRIEHSASDEHYILSFRSITIPFADADPRVNSDTDGDGLSDGTESRLSAQDPAVQQAMIPGYNGLSDPGKRNLFLTLDLCGSSYALTYNTKQMVVSQFACHDIAMRFDDGYLGDGGDVLPYQEEVTTANASAFRDGPDGMFAGRGPVYRYCVSADEACCEGHSGVGNFPPGRVLVVARQTEVAQYSPIVLMHELGHTLGLCHRQGDDNGIEAALCSTPVAERPVQCSTYCGVGQDDNTAMGANLGGIGAIISLGLVGLALGIWLGIKLGGLIGGAIGGIPGAIVGAIGGAIVGAVLTFLGALGGFLMSDAYLRLVDYAPQEWDNLVFFRAVVGL